MSLTFWVLYLDLYQPKKKAVAFGRTFDEEEFEQEKQAKKGKKKGKKKQIKVEKLNVRNMLHLPDPSIFFNIRPKCLSKFSELISSTVCLVTTAEMQKRCI